MAISAVPSFLFESASLPFSGDFGVAVDAEFRSETFDDFVETIAVEKIFFNKSLEAFSRVHRPIRSNQYNNAAIISLFAV